MKNLWNFLIMLIGLILLAIPAFSQNNKPVKQGSEPTPAHLDSLKAHELILQQIGDSMLNGSNQEVRIKAVVKFIPYFLI